MIKKFCTFLSFFQEVVQMYHTLVEVPTYFTQKTLYQEQKGFQWGWYLQSDVYLDSFWWETVQQQHVQAQETWNLNWHRTPAI